VPVLSVTTVLNLLYGLKLLLFLVMIALGYFVVRLMSRADAG